jgi:PAS domain S-box-containing protein
MNQPIDTNKEMQPVLSEPVVFRLDLDGNILSVNEAGERLTGYSAVELARLNVLDLLPGQCAADLRAMANRSIRHRFGTVFEIEVMTSDRQQIPVEVSIDLIRRPDGTLEFSGIAVPKNDAAASCRPRCLDIRFQFKASKHLNAELQAAW